MTASRMRIVLGMRALEQRLMSTRLGWILLVVVAIFLAHAIVQRVIGSNAGKMEIDFAAYTAAAQVMNDGGLVYPEGEWPLLNENPVGGIELAPGVVSRENQYYLYPPMLAWGLGWMAWVSYGWLEMGWNGLSLLAYCGGIVLWLRMRFRDGKLTGLECLGWCVIGVYWAPLVLATNVGQVTPVLFVMLVAHAMLAYVTRDGWSGAVLGLAILLKVSPVMWLAYWVLMRRWKLVGVSVAVVLLGSVITGWSESVRFMTSVFAHLSLGENSPLNHSFTGALLRIVYGEPWGWIDPQTYSEHLVAHGAVRALGLLGIAVSILVAVRVRGESRVYLGLAMILLGQMVWAPVARLHDMVIVVWVMLVVYEFLREHGGVVGWVLWGYVLLTLNRNVIAWHEWMAFDPLSEELLSHPPTLALLLLWGYVAVRFWTTRPVNSAPHISE